MRVEYLAMNSKVIEVRKFIAHRFQIPFDSFYKKDFMPLLEEWHKSDAGQWIIENQIGELVFEYFLSNESYSYLGLIYATLESKKLTEYYLRFT